VLFVKPLLVRLEGTQAGAAVYRKVVIRNVVCTVLVCTSYIITTAVMVSALLRETPEDNKVRVAVVSAHRSKSEGFSFRSAGDQGLPTI